MSRSIVRLTLGVAACLVAVPAVGHGQTFVSTKVNIGGEGGMDYIVADTATGRVFLPRGTHVMVIEGASGKVLGDITGTPRVHGVAISQRDGHGFTTNAGDSSVTMFDLKSLAVLRKIPTRTGGLDGIMYDDFNDRVVLTNHSRPIGTATVIDAKTGNILGEIELEDNAPEGAASDGKGRLFVNNETKNTIQVLDAENMKVVASWPIAPCDGPTGIAYDRATDRIFSGCSGKSVVVNAKTGKVVAEIPNGDGVDALGWDPVEKLMYIPAGQSGNVTVVHQDSPDKYTVIATVPTMRGARTIVVDAKAHVAYTFTPEFGPAPTPAAGAPPAGRGGARGPMVGAWLFTIRH